MLISFQAQTVHRKPALIPARQHMAHPVTAMINGESLNSMNKSKDVPDIRRFALKKMAPTSSLQAE